MLVKHQGILFFLIRYLRVGKPHSSAYQRHHKEGTMPILQTCATSFPSALTFAVDQTEFQNRTDQFRRAAAASNILSFLSLPRVDFASPLISSNVSLIMDRETFGERLSRITEQQHEIKKQRAGKARATERGLHNKLPLL